MRQKMRQKESKKMRQKERVQTATSAGWHTGTRGRCQPLAKRHGGALCLSCTQSTQRAQRYTKPRKGTRARIVGTNDSCLGTAQALHFTTPGNSIRQEKARVAWQPVPPSFRVSQAAVDLDDTRVNRLLTFRSLFLCILTRQ